MLSLKRGDPFRPGGSQYPPVVQPKFWKFYHFTFNDNLDQIWRCLHVVYPRKTNNQDLAWTPSKAYSWRKARRTNLPTQNQTQAFSSRIQPDLPVHEKQNSRTRRTPRSFPLLRLVLRIKSSSQFSTGSIQKKNHNNILAQSTLWPNHELLPHSWGQNLLQNIHSAIELND